MPRCRSRKCSCYRNADGGTIRVFQSRERSMDVVYSSVLVDYCVAKIVGAKHQLHLLQSRSLALPAGLEPIIALGVVICCRPQEVPMPLHKRSMLGFLDRKSTRLNSS